MPKFYVSFLPIPYYGEESNFESTIVCLPESVMVTKETISSALEQKQLHAQMILAWSLVDFKNENVPIHEKHNGHAYVDLGLPSGTLWATMNVGAESETDYGLYFAWGETQGYPDTTSGKLFDWNDYKYGTYFSDLTKYNPTDKLTTLESGDDAAAVNWGGEWHMPDEAQIVELFDESNCVNEWTEHYNKSDTCGILFTSVRNGHTLFFPAAGYCVEGTVIANGEETHIWSRSLLDGRADCLEANNNTQNITPYCLYDGLSVRGVKSSGRLK